MARALLLIVAVLACMAQSGDRLHLRAGICADRTCTALTVSGFEPARVFVFVVIPQHRENRALVYGVVCDGVEVARSEAQLDGDADGPSFSREYRDIAAGSCVAVAVLERANGARLTARSGRLMIWPRG